MKNPFSIFFKPSIDPSQILFNEWYMVNDILHHVPCRSPLVGEYWRFNGQLHCERCKVIPSEDVLLVAEAWESFRNYRVLGFYM